MGDCTSTAATSPSAKASARLRCARSSAEKRAARRHVDRDGFRDAELARGGVGRERVLPLGMNRRKADHLVAPSDSAGHERRLDERSRAVVHRGVGDVHSGQRADHRLVLVDRLERALADLGLVGRVGGEELRLRHDVIDDARDVVVVAAGTHEAHQFRRRDVLIGERGHMRRELDLREALGQVQSTVEPDGLRNDIEQRINVGQRRQREAWLRAVRT